MSDEKPFMVRDILGREFWAVKDAAGMITITETKPPEKVGDDAIIDAIIREMSIHEAVLADGRTLQRLMAARILRTVRKLLAEGQT